MSQIYSIHSYRGGTGKSNITANLAFLAAKHGNNVAVLDTDLQSPGVHMVFGLEKDRVVHTLPDFLFGRCDIEDTAYDMTPKLDVGDSGGKVYLLPAKLSLDEIAEIISKGYDVNKLNRHFNELIASLQLDILFLDTHPGLNRETMLTTAISDTLIIVVRPDTQDYEGTAVLAEVAGQLGVSRVFMVANKVVDQMNPEKVKQRIQEAFKYEVVGVLPLSQDMAILGSRGLFTLQYPAHEVSREFDNIVDRLLENSSNAH